MNIKEGDVVIRYPGTNRGYLDCPHAGSWRTGEILPTTKCSFDGCLRRTCKCCTTDGLCTVHQIYLCKEDNIAIVGYPEDFIGTLTKVLDTKEARETSSRIWVVPTISNADFVQLKFKEVKN